MSGSVSQALGLAGSDLVMPPSATVATGDVSIKTAVATAVTANAAGFWTAIDLSHTALGWESVKLAAAANTTEQTIVDTTGEGVLTHVLAPVLSGSGTMTIRVTADGKEFTFVSETIASAARFILGDFRPGLATATATSGRGVGAGGDTGYSNTVVPVTMSTPIQAVTESRIGIKFESTIKVTIQGSVNISGSAQLLNAAACYTLDLPEGL